MPVLRTRIALFSLLCLLSPSATAVADNFINVVLSRIDDYRAPSDQFSASIEVSLPDVSGVSAVSISTSGGLFSLDPEESGTWHLRTRYADLPTMQGDLDGQWTISVSGAQPSTSTFNLQASALENTDFFPTAAGLNPAHGSSGVSAGSLLSWSQPPGAESALGLFVNVDSQNNFQDDNSLFGTLSISDEQWQPSLPLSPGENQFTVSYYVVDSSFISALVVNSGSITWGDSPFAPPGYPAQTPLLPLGAETTIAFNAVPEPEACLMFCSGVLGVVLWKFKQRRRIRQRPA